MNNYRQVLLDRLVKGGADPSSIDSILRTLSKLLASDPDIDPSAANERLRYLGWPEVELDYHILQLALAYFELDEEHRHTFFKGGDHRRQAMRLREVDTVPIALNDI
jgi:hypothetical protein